MTENTETDKIEDRIRNINDRNFLNYLSSAYEVLRKIFSFLSLEDLETVSKAFEDWKPVVETTKNERIQIESFVIYPRSQEIQVWSEASICFTFCAFKNKDILKNLKKHLKKNAEFLIIECHAGVVGTYNDLSGLIQRPNSNCVKSLIFNNSPTVHLRIPNFPGFGYKIFSWKKNISFEEFRNNFKIPDNQVIKCLLILITVQDNNTESSDQKDDFVSYLRTIQSEEFAVGGCLIDLFVGDPDIITKYIVFYGEKVEAASTVLKGNTITKRGIDLAVEELKEMCPKTDKGLLFVFRCYSRNEMFNKGRVKKLVKEWEGDSIIKHFPATPVIGCFGYGEFGRKFPKNKESKPLNKRTKKSNIWEHSFATSIVYIGFKK